MQWCQPAVDSFLPKVTSFSLAPRATFTHTEGGSVASEEINKVALITITNVIYYLYISTSNSTF